MYLRDAATTGRLFPIMHLHNFNHLKPHQITLAYKESEAIIRFIEQEYGREKLRRILPVIKTKFDAHSFLQELVHQDVFSFNRRFREYMEERYEPYLATHAEPDRYGRRLTESGSLPVFNTNPIFLNEGKTIAYISDRDGFNAIYAANSDGSGEPELLIGRRVDAIDRIYTAGHALAKSPDGRFLVFAGEYKQRSSLFVYDLARRRLRRIRFRLDEVSSPCFSPDGATLAFVGMKDSVTDIYTANLRGWHLRQLTRDANSDGYPVFTPDGSRLIYVSETAGAGAGCETDLYMLSLEDLSARRVTFLPGDEQEPALSPDGETIYFINDQDHIRELYRLDIGAGSVRKLTSCIGGIFTPQMSPDNEHIVFAAFRNGETHIYLGNQASFDETPVTAGSPPPAPPAGTTEASVGTLPTVCTPEHGYGFKASTDLVFPILFYSSLDGFFAQIYYQASEYLGNHQLQASVVYGSGEDFLDYSFVYSYLRFRPNIYAGASGDNYYEDIERTDRRLEHAQFLGVEYPLNRVASVYLQGTTIYRRERYRDQDNHSIKDRENVGALSLVRDTTMGRYLFRSRGSRLRLTYQYAGDEFASDYAYRNHIVEGARFIPAPAHSVVALRALGGVSAGINRGVFRLGGSDRVRGYSRNSDANKYSRIALATLQVEFPLVDDMNYYMWYLFPDFFFKSMRGVVFTDAGIGWETRDQLEGLNARDVRHSFGLGLHFYTFILQTFQLNLNFDWVKRTDSPGSIFYFSLGPTF